MKTTSNGVSGCCSVLVERTGRKESVEDSFGVSDAVF
jgi:hypothetical protein